MTTLTVPELSLILLVGASSTGKSTFARRHFLPSEVLSNFIAVGLVPIEDLSPGATDAAPVQQYILAYREWVPNPAETVGVHLKDDAVNTSALANVFMTLADNKVTLVSIRSVGQQTEQAFLDLVEKEESRGFARAYQHPEAA